MNQLLAALAAAAGAILGGLIVFASDRLPGLTFAMAIAGVGALLGQGVAAYRYGRNPATNTTRIIFAWSAAGFSVGWLLYLVSELV